jgi:hypothetical protein
MSGWLLPKPSMSGNVSRVCVLFEALLLEHILSIVALEVYKDFNNVINIVKMMNKRAFPVIIRTNIFQDIQHGKLFIIDSIYLPAYVFPSSWSIQEERSEMRTPDNQWKPLNGDKSSFVQRVAQQSMVRPSTFQGAIHKYPVGSMLHGLATS